MTLPDFEALYRRFNNNRVIDPTDLLRTFDEFRQFLSQPTPQVAQPIAACIGAADISETLEVLGENEWTPVVVPTATSTLVLRGGSHDAQGGFTVSAIGVEPQGSSLVRLSYRLFVGAGGQPTLDGAILIDGSPQAGSQSPGRVAPASGGVLLVGECLRVVPAGSLLQVGVKRRTGTGNLTVYHFSLTLNNI